MNDFYFPRNLLGIVAPFGGGKTEGLNHIKYGLKKRKIPYNPNVISDGQFIVDAINNDHITGGKNHIHPPEDISEADLLYMCEQNDVYGHTHDDVSLNLGFAVTNYPIPVYMYTNFTSTLARVSDTSQITLFEWSGGGTGYPEGHPIARADYSYATQRQEFENGTYTNFFPQVLGILHPDVPGDFETRLRFNNRRKNHTPTPQEITEGSRSWYIPPAGMRLSTYDDSEFIFDHIRQIEPEVSIYDIYNDGGNEYFDGIDAALDQIFKPWLDAEGRPKKSRSERSGNWPGWRK